MGLRNRAQNASGSIGDGFSVSTNEQGQWSRSSAGEQKVSPPNKTDKGRPIPVRYVDEESIPAEGSGPGRAASNTWIIALIVTPTLVAMAAVAIYAAPFLEDFFLEGLVWTRSAAERGRRSRAGGWEQEEQEQWSRSRSKDEEEMDVASSSCRSLRLVEDRPVATYAFLRPHARHAPLPPPPPVPSRRPRRGHSGKNHRPCRQLVGDSPAHPCGRDHGVSGRSWAKGRGSGSWGTRLTVPQELGVRDRMAADAPCVVGSEREGVEEEGGKVRRERGKQPPDAGAQGDPEVRGGECFEELNRCRLSSLLPFLRYVGDNRRVKEILYEDMQVGHEEDEDVSVHDQHLWTSCQVCGSTRAGDKNAPVVPWDLSSLCLLKVETRNIRGHVSI
eukprot:62458-Hanusia_phi.AAC.2